MKKIIPIIIIVILLVFIRNTAVSILDTTQEDSVSTKLEKQIESEKKRQTYLKERLYEAQSDDFIEEEAKEKLGYLREGEYFVIAPTQAPKNTRPIEIDTRSNLEKWWELFF